eukprot:12009103-Ditylum_brightwellii.AAC.1
MAFKLDVKIIKQKSCSGFGIFVAVAMASLALAKPLSAAAADCCAFYNSLCYYTSNNPKAATMMTMMMTKWYLQ